MDIRDGVLIPFIALNNGKTVEFIFTDIRHEIFCDAQKNDAVANTVLDTLFEKFEEKIQNYQEKTGIVYQIVSNPHNHHKAASGENISLTLLLNRSIPLETLTEFANLCSYQEVLKTIEEIQQDMMADWNWDEDEEEDGDEEE